MNLRAYPIKVRLRDGSQVQVRAMDAKDGPAVLEFFRALPEEDRMFLRDDVTRPEWLDRFVRQIDYQTMLPLVAEDDKGIVGNAVLHRPLYGWSVHVGEMRVAVARAYQHKGLGTALAHELVKLALDLGLEKMIVSVVDNQIAAKRAFQKLGFHPEAVLKGHVKDIHGIKRDLVIMSNDVSHIWESMIALMRDYSPSLE
ncbi:MAG: GNAT family N-acetyltransferase [Verrucomicrobiae bacterium]|nr:GNAT family N-acetyltransferase [Verrucomicrobiae bacterium]